MKTNYFAKVNFIHLKKMICSKQRFPVEDETQMVVKKENMPSGATDIDSSVLDYALDNEWTRFQIQYLRLRKRVMQSRMLRQWSVMQIQKKMNSTA